MPALAFHSRWSPLGETTADAMTVYLCRLNSSWQGGDEGHVECVAADPHGGGAVPAEVALVPVTHCQLPQHRGSGAAVVRVKVHEERRADGPPLVAQVGAIRGLDVDARGPGSVGDLARVFVGTQLQHLVTGRHAHRDELQPTAHGPAVPRVLVALGKGAWVGEQVVVDDGAVGRVGGEGAVEVCEDRLVRGRGRG
eukprot:scaffold1079_cov45-Phaeocystis_antarctica.AAC.2